MMQTTTTSRVHVAGNGFDDGTKKNLVDDARLVRMCDRFYEKAFQDPHLDRFIRSHHDPHGARLGKWIAQKMGYTQSGWSDELLVRPQTEVTVAGGRKVIVHDRTSAHVAAWHCVKREPERVGRRFKLEDTRVWMRLMFWSAREEGLLEDAVFERDFCQLIEHFIAVYERSAPPYTVESMLWSANEGNIERYIEQGRMMLDVLQR